MPKPCSPRTRRLPLLEKSNPCEAIWPASRMTRPAPGLEASEAMVQFFCGVELPGQPSISARSFDDLEDRLLDPP